MNDKTAKLCYAGDIIAGLEREAQAAKARTRQKTSTGPDHFQTGIPE